MSVRSRPLSVKSSQSAASSLALNAAQARADLAVAKARAEFNRKKAEANRARIEAEAEMDRLQIEEALTAAQVRADTLETELQLLQNEYEGSVLPELPVDEPDQRVVEWRNEEPVVSVAEEDIDSKPPVVSQPSHSESTSQLLTAIGLSMNMPKPEICTFDGNHLEYWNFINTFEVNVASKAIDDRSRLTYLIQFCVGKARNSIANCVLLGGSKGYAEAKRILKEEFGQPHVIAKAHLSKVLNRPQVRPNDGKGLWDLASDMCRCQTVLSQMCYSADMNSSETLLKIQQLLPIYLQTKWAKKAHAMMEKLTTPDFKCMSSFIEEAAKLANNMYGQNIGGSYPKNTQKWKSNSKGTTTLTTTAGHAEANLKTETRLTCPTCSGSHKLEKCKDFIRYSREERLKILRKERLCDNCFGTSHIARRCLKPSQCERGCKWKHHTLLHRSNEERKDTSKATTVGLTGAGDYGLATIVPVKVRAKDSGVILNTYALLDEGSNSSFCTLELCKRLKTSSKTRSLRIATVNQTRSQNCKLLHELEIMDMDCENVIKLPEVYTLEVIPASKCDIMKPEDLRNWPYLDRVELKYIDAEIGLLIGSNVPKALEPLEVINSVGEGPYAVKSILGWSVHGIPIASRETTHVNRIHSKAVSDALVEMYNMDFSERKIDDTRQRSVEDRRFIKLLDETTCFNEGHYEVPLPWKNKVVKMPDNKPLAEKRAAHLLRKLRDPEFHKEYTKFMDDMFEKGYAEKAPVRKDGEREVHNKWFIPHHGVFHKQKHKLRVVFDCGARYGGKSLNYELLQGPDLTSSLVGVLLRFQEEPVALTADIESMFYQVRVPERDRDMLRFLWWPNGDVDQPLEEYRMAVHVFGAVSSPSCVNYALRKAAENAKGRYQKAVCDTICRNFYVDDYLVSVPTNAEAIIRAKDTSSLCKENGFRLTKWMSNEREVIESIPICERAKNIKDVELAILPTERTLGILWSDESDEFRYKNNLSTNLTTRRGVLSMLSSIYDPLGYVSPAILPAKQILQELCRKKLGWDAQIPRNN